MVILFGAGGHLFRGQYYFFQETPHSGEHSGDSPALSFCFSDRSDVPARLYQSRVQRAGDMQAYRLGAGEPVPVRSGDDEPWTWGPGDTLHLVPQGILAGDRDHRVCYHGRLRGGACH